MRPTSLPGLTVMKASMQCSTRKNELKIELPTKPLTKSQKHYRFFISSIKGNPKRRSNIIHHHSSSRFQSVLLPTSASSLLFALPAINSVSISISKSLNQFSLQNWIVKYGMQTKRSSCSPPCSSWFCIL